MFNYNSVFPVNKQTKAPLTAHGFKDASSDPAVIDKWTEMFPDCAWGYPTGDGVFVIDVDKKSGGLESWKALTDQNGEPETYTVGTMNGGLHVYFTMPTGTVVKNSTSKFAQGIDTRGEGGYVVTPMDNPKYVVVKDAPVAYPPLWVMERLDFVFKKQPFKQSFVLPDKITNGERNGVLFAYACSLQARGKSDEEIALALEKANQDKCDEPVSDRELSQILTSSLGRYEKGLPKFEANTDGVKEAGKHAVASEYLQAMISLGYSFSLNVVDDSIYVNGKRMSDVLEQELLYNLDNLGYGSREKAVKAYTYEAMQHQFHPVRDYLVGLKWDGCDHIGELASYFDDEENVFGKWLRKWLIGSVAKVLPYPTGKQNRVLVLVGGQGAGKSFFARWLCQDLPDYHAEEAINPENKDDTIRKMSKWIWEVRELGATTRRADMEALKGWLSNEHITVRMPYGRHELHKYALANFIATVNSDGTGFLSDPTGNRRYMACTIKTIDWAYSQNVDIKQVWAQAVALFNSGEKWDLEGEDLAIAAEINEVYEVESPMQGYIGKFFDVDATEVEWMMHSNEIIEVLKKQGVMFHSDRGAATDIGRVLQKAKLIKRKESGYKDYSTRVWVWRGIKPKTGFETLDMALDGVLFKDRK